MWKRDEQPAASQPVAPSSPAKAERSEGQKLATIGQSICIKGEITGAEDLVVEGSIEGNIELKQNCVVIGKGGRVKANINAKMIQVYGEVTGDLVGSEQIIIHESGTVRGNVSAPRVALKDGARLKGAINTDADAGRAGSKSPEASAKPAANGAKPHAGASAHM
jgi:cytoskeletal protein CcmA (bactofilin family)